jgi:hypothetical protein
MEGTMAKTTRRKADSGMPTWKTMAKTESAARGRIAKLIGHVRSQLNEDVLRYLIGECINHVAESGPDAVDEMAVRLAYDIWENNARLSNRELGRKPDNGELFRMAIHQIRLEMQNEDAARRVGPLLAKCDPKENEPLKAYLAAFRHFSQAREEMLRARVAIGLRSDDAIQSALVKIAEDVTAEVEAVSIETMKHVRAPAKEVA